MKTKILAVVLCVLAVSIASSADNIRGIDMDFVTIGHAGNIADATGFGAVGYNYRIGKYEVTNAQWNTFKAVAGTPTGAGSGYQYSAYYTGGWQPTNNVSWYEAAQFCNYLTSGDKNKGAYQFSGNDFNPGSFIGINRDLAISSYGKVYVIPTEDEWYKAAYYKPDSSGYSLYANGTNTAPIAYDQSNYNFAISAPWNVGTGAIEQNGTFDMMGNVCEWNEALIDSNRGFRGGTFVTSSYVLESSLRPTGNAPSTEYSYIGFRIASVPEPATMLLIGLGGMFLNRRKKIKSFGE